MMRRRSWLRLRHLLGWGRPPAYFRMVAVNLLTLAGLAGMVGLGALLTIYWARDAGVQAAMKGVLVAAGACIAALLLLGVACRRRARAAARGELLAVRGRCWALVAAPVRHPRLRQLGRGANLMTLLTTPTPHYFGRLYARVGADAASARWYVLPEEWGPALEPAAATHTLEVLSTTGWVARLDDLDRTAALSDARPVDRWSVAGEREANDDNAD